MSDKSEITTRPILIKLAYTLSGAGALVELIGLVAGLDAVFFRAMAVMILGVSMIITELLWEVWHD